MAEPSAKVFKQTLDETLDGEADNIDRISALPESVLLHILSLLELKEAAATSILSTTWRVLFLQFPEIDLTFNIHGNSFEHPRLFHLFTLFANRVLRERNPEAPITILKMSVRHFNGRLKPDYISLLSAAASALSTYNVKEIDLALGTCSLKSKTSSIDLPPAMFISESLVGLRLTLCLGWNVPENVWLPNLRYAHLIPYKLKDENSIQRLLDGSPMLENLMILMMVSTIDDHETAAGVKTLHMWSSSLKLLMVGWDMIGQTEMNISVKCENLERLTLTLKGGHKVNVDAPNLNFLSIRGQVLELNMAQTFASINEAIVDVEYTSKLSNFNDLYARSQNASNFLRDLQNLTLLSLSENIMKALYVSTAVMPIFRNLHKIKLIPDYCHDFPRNWVAQVLFNFFGSCPNLRVLSFDKVFNNYFGQIDFESVFPISMVQHLKELEIFDFKGRDMEYNLVQFFMNNGQSLQIVALRKDNLRPRGYNWKPKQRKRILSFRTFSEECEVLFR